MTDTYKPLEGTPEAIWEHLCEISENSNAPKPIIYMASCVLPWYEQYGAIWRGGRVEGLWNSLDTRAEFSFLFLSLLYWAKQAGDI